MFTQVNRRFAAALMAMAVVISNVIAPVSPAFATDGGGETGTGEPGTYQLAWCQKTGNGWKIQIGGSNENRYALLMTDAIKALGTNNVDTSIANGHQVKAHDQSTRLNADFCDTQFTAPAPSYSAVPTCSANDPISWIYDATKLTISPASPTYAGHVISATFTPITPYTLKNANGHTVSSLTLTYTDVQPNNCIVKDATATVSTLSNPTCTNNSVASVTGLAHATLTSNNGVLDQSVGSHSATFTADSGHLFASGQSTVTVDYQILPHEVGVQCAGPKPTDKDTRTQTSDAICLPGGGGIVYSWTEERFRTVYLNNSNQWVTGHWSAWVPVLGSKTSVPATDAECPKPTQVEPTCNASGSLTLPAYKEGTPFVTYTYYVWVNGIKTSYSASKDIVVANIPQGATVEVKLYAGTEVFGLQIYKHTFTFSTSDCIAIPQPPVPIDECGLDNAHWVAPADTNDVHWYLNAKGELIAKAVGGKFTNHHRFINFGVAKDSNEVCPPVVVTPVKPQITDCKAVLPITLGITYKEVYLDAKGNIVDPSQAGIVATQQGVLATANAGYVLAPSNDGGKYLDNQGYLYVLDFTGMNCGKGDITPPTVTPPATTTAAVLPTPAELPHTGSSLSGLLVTLLATLSTYGVVYFLQPKRR